MPTQHSLSDLGFILAKQYPSIDPDLLENVINMRYTQCLRAGGYVWSRLEVDDAPLELAASYTVGTLFVTQGSTAITGVGTTWTTLMTGLNIRIAGRDEFYTFTYLSATTGTLDRIYEGPSDATGLTSYAIFQRIYKLDQNCRELHGIKVPATNRYLMSVTRDYLDTVAASRTEQSSYPFVYAPYQDASDGSPQVEIYPIPQLAIGLLYHYKTAKNELSQPSDTIPTWFPYDALLMGCHVDLSIMATPIINRTTGIWAARQQQVNEQRFAQLLSEAISEDINSKPTQQLKMDERFTGHRRARQFSDQALHWFELRNSNG